MKPREANGEPCGNCDPYHELPPATRRCWDCGVGSGPCQCTSEFAAYEREMEKEAVMAEHESTDRRWSDEATLSGAEELRRLHNAHVGADHLHEGEYEIVFLDSDDNVTRTVGRFPSPRAASDAVALVRAEAVIEAAEVDQTLRIVEAFRLSTQRKGVTPKHLAAANWAIGFIAAEFFRDEDTR